MVNPRKHLKAAPILALLCAVALSGCTLLTQRAAVVTESHEAFMDSYETVFHGRIESGRYWMRPQLQGILYGSISADKPMYGGLSFEVLSVIKGSESRKKIHFDRVLDGQKNFIYRTGEDFLVGVGATRGGSDLGLFRLETYPGSPPRPPEAVLFWLASESNAVILNPTAPANGRELVRDYIDPQYFGVSRTDELTITEPCREYFVGLTNLASGHLLSAARPGGWRYLLLHGTNVVGATVLDADAKTGKILGFNSLKQRGFAEETLEALRTAAKLPQIQEDYEPRLLNLPGVAFVATWFHGKSDDFILPLPPTFGRVKAYQPYSEEQIVELLKSDAETAIKSPIYKNPRQKL